MVPQASAVIAAVFLMFGTSGSVRDKSGLCQQTDTAKDGVYPEHRYSPLESLENYDMVFHGEVVVGTKPCSLGHCAGIKVLENIAGYRGKRNTIVRVRGEDEQCIPGIFTTPGERWIIYGQRKLTAGGTPFMEVSLKDPIFPATIVPDYEQLENTYFLLRARLDYAIEKKRSYKKQLR